MITNPDLFFGEFIAAGSDCCLAQEANGNLVMTVHPGLDISRSLIPYCSDNPAGLPND